MSGLQTSSWRLDDDARRRAVRVQLAVAIGDAAFGRGRAAADVDDFRLAAERPDLASQRPREIHVQLERGEALAGRHHRVDRAAERGVEQRRRKSTVRDTGAVVKAFLGFCGEYHAAFLDLDQPDVEELQERRWFDFTLDQFSEEVDAAHAAARFGERHDALARPEPVDLPAVASAEAEG